MWAQIINTLIGLWLMSAPALLEFGDSASTNGYILGPLIITFSVISYWEATRSVRLWNLLPAVWLILAPWILGYNELAPILNDTFAGLLVLIFSCIRGKIDKSYGGGWKALWSDNPQHMPSDESS